MSSSRLSRPIAKNIIVEECWLPVPGYESMYEVSSLGRVYSLDRKSWNGFRWRRVRARFLRPILSGKGYKNVKLSKCGVIKRFDISRLVLLAFSGPCPLGHEASHLNGKSKDDRFCNLKWETPKQNTHRKIEHGTQLYGRDQATKSKLTEQEVRDIRHRAALKEPRKQLAACFGVSVPTICDTVNRKRWKWVS